MCIAVYNNWICFCDRVFFINFRGKRKGFSAPVTFGQIKFMVEFAKVIIGLEAHFFGPVVEDIVENKNRLWNWMCHYKVYLYFILKNIQ